MADPFVLDSKKWEAFIRGLDRQSVNEFRKGLRKSTSLLRKNIQADWSGGRIGRRTGKSRRSITQRIVSTSRLMSGRPIIGTVEAVRRKGNKAHVVRFHEHGYNLRRTKGGPVIRFIPGKHIVENRTDEHNQVHRRIMEETIRGLIRRVTLLS